MVRVVVDGQCVALICHTQSDRYVVQTEHISCASTQCSGYIAAIISFIQCQGSIPAQAIFLIKLIEHLDIINSTQILVRIQSENLAVSQLFVVMKVLSGFQADPVGYGKDLLICIFSRQVMYQHHHHRTTEQHEKVICAIRHLFLGVSLSYFYFFYIFWDII